jgi:hypothetical protein
MPVDIKRLIIYAAVAAITTFLVTPLVTQVVNDLL